jgi:hypothetical protein
MPAAFVKHERPLTQADVRAIRKLRADGKLTERELARAFGVLPTTIHRVSRPVEPRWASQSQTLHLDRPPSATRHGPLTG